ncbi:MAG: 50S ribosomal protein L18 [bacterium]
MKKVQKQRMQRLRRTRKRVRGTTERPRLSVFRSNKNIYAQIIDDTVGKTIIAASTMMLEGKKDVSNKINKVEAAQIVGKMMAAKAQEKGIKVVVFDRGSYRYHGRVKAVADAAREGGIMF